MLYYNQDVRFKLVRKDLGLSRIGRIAWFAASPSGYSAIILG